MSNNVENKVNKPFSSIDNVEKILLVREFLKNEKLDDNILTISTNLSEVLCYIYYGKSIIKYKENEK